MKKKNGVASEILLQKILFIRGKKVMLDSDIAELYGVPTSRLNEAVKRNKKRFPRDFMFRLTVREKAEVFENYAHLAGLKYSAHLPYAFTEHGTVMLASILNSQRAIQMNIQVVRMFNKMREFILSNKDLWIKLSKLEKLVNEQSFDIQLIFEQLKNLLMQKEKPRSRIGFKK